MHIPRAFSFRLFVVLLFSVLCGFSIFLLFQSSQEVESLQQDITLGVTAQSLLSKQQDISRVAYDHLYVLSTVPDVIEMNQPNCNQILSELLEGQSFFLTFAVVDEHFNIACSGVPVEEIINVSDRQYLQAAVKNRVFSMSEYQISRTTEKPSINFAFPVVLEGGAVRVLVAAVALDAVDLFLRHSNFPKGSSFTLTDRSGVVLSRFPYNTAYAGSTIPESELYDLFRDQFHGVREVEDLDQERRTMSFAPIYYQGTNHVGTIFYGIPVPKVDVSAGDIGLAGAIVCFIILFFFAIRNGKNISV
jgi:C4-dicarboxylate-specific signal transduction histidine kinase